MIDQTVIAAIIIIVAAILQFFQINYAGDLTMLINSLAVVAAAVWAWYQRTTLVKAPDGIGDVSATGMRR